MPPSPRRDALIVLAVALVARLAVFSQLSDFPLFIAPAGDTLEYLGDARRIAGGDLLGSDSVYFHSSPIYGYLLALALVSGVGTATDLSMVALLQALVSAGTAVLTWALGRRVAGPGVGLAAGLLVALAQPAVFYDTALLADFLLPLGFAAAALLLIDVRSPRRMLAVGAVLGLAALARPNALLLLAPAAVVAWPRVGLRGVAALGLGAALLVAPVTARNVVAGGHLVLISSNGGINFYIGNNDAATGAFKPPAEGDKRWSSHLEDSSVAHARAQTGEELGPAEVSRYYTDKTVAWIAAHPAEFVGLIGRRIRLLGAAYEIPNHMDLAFAANESRVLRWLPVRWALVMPLALAGGVLGLRRREAWPLIGFAGVYLGSIALLFFVTGRYRFPVFPLLAVLAAAAVPWARASRPWLAGLAGLAAASGVALAVWPAPDEIRVGPDYSLRHLASVYEAWEDLPAAIAALEAAVRADPSESFGWNNLGLLLARTGDLDGAAQALDRALALAPDDPEVLANLGLVHLRGGHTTDAVAHLERAVALDPRTPVLHVGLATARRETGDIAGAHAALDAALALNKNLPSIWFQRALLCEVEGNLVCAVESWRAGLVLAPDHQAARVRLAAIEP